MHDRTIDASAVGLVTLSWHRQLRNSALLKRAASRRLTTCTVLSALERGPAVQFFATCILLCCMHAHVRVIILLAAVAGCARRVRYSLRNDCYSRVVGFSGFLGGSRSFIDVMWCCSQHARLSSMKMTRLQLCACITGHPGYKLSRHRVCIHPLDVVSLVGASSFEY